MQYNESASNNKRIAKNTLMLYVRQLFVLVLGLVSARILLKELGETDYGVYNVVGGIITILNLVNTTLTGATQRFISFDIGLNNTQRINKTFNTVSIILASFGVLVIIFAETIGVWFLNEYLVIPDERREAANLIFQFTVFSYFINLIQIPYIATLIAFERMDYYATISIVDVLLKLGIVLALPFVPGHWDKMIAYGILLFIVTLTIAMLYRVYIKVKYKYIHFQVVNDRNYLKTLLSYSGWNIMGSIANIIQIQAQNIFINIFFGPAVNAAQAISSQLTSAFGSLQSNFQTASNPQIVKDFAKGDMGTMNNLVTKTSKFSAYLVLFMIIPAFLETDYLLHVWLVSPPEWANIFVKISLWATLLNAISGSLIMAIQATGKVAIYQTISSLILVLYVPVTYYLYKHNNPPYSAHIVYLSSAVALLVYRIAEVRKQIESFDVKSFCTETILIPICVSGICLFFSYLIVLFLKPSLLRFIIVLATSTFLLFSTIWSIGLKKEERASISDYLRRRGK